jgi:Thiamine pyrophosphate-requiring enzymes [acetolactate synthase, pyruvate dehydrogenase (cytochrome), glyoxylate carboligase, phosphonopyruvate decarboxylase]
MPNLRTKKEPDSIEAWLPQGPYSGTGTVAEAILMQLKLWGVKRIYGVVGDAIFGLMDALAKQSDIAFIAVKHESAAAMMASAEAKLTGNLGVCAAQMGPGLANLVNGLGDAYLDKAPVLAITGQAPLNKIGTFYKQYINQQELIAPISSYSQLVVHPDAVLDSLTQAMLASMSYRTVTHLSVPKDLFHLPSSAQPCEPPKAILPLSVPEPLQQALRFMQSAKQPMLLIGRGARSGREEIQSLAEAWGSGIAMSYGAVGIVPDAHPLMLNGLGEGGNPYLAELFKQADLVVAIETTWWPEGAVPANPRVIQIAERSADLGGAIPANIGIAGDIPTVVRHLTGGLSSHRTNPAWITRIRQCKKTWSAENEKERNQSGSPLSPSRLIRVLEQTLAEDAIVALDEGDSTLWFLRNFRPRGQHVLLSDRWRTMGFGLPAAMAAKLCSPNQQVVCITGDGGLGMVLADLVTAARYRLPITVIVFNNGTLQMERDKMTMEGLRPEGTNLSNPDFAKVAEACGWRSYRIETAEQMEQALAQSKTSPIPVLLDVLTAQIPHPDFITQ